MRRIGVLVLSTASGRTPMLSPHAGRGEKSAPVLAAHPRPSFCKTAMSKASSLRGAERRSNPVLPRDWCTPPWIASLSLAMTNHHRASRNTSFFLPDSPPARKRSGTPANAGSYLPHASGVRFAPRKGGLRRPPLAGALACRRSTTALAKRTRHPQGSASGQVSWDAAACVGRRYRPCLSQPSGHPTPRS